ncbi:MAG: SCO family protein [Robiginitomaculum sp.]|nr:SCO family protein [Robiginitomaculum sp.]MDQ7076745.1 SCO family protein [Robiginitomaculum sp.]
MYFSHKLYLPIIGAGAVLALVLAGCTRQEPPRSQNVAASPPGLAQSSRDETQNTPIGGRFILRTHTGKVVTDQDFQGQFLLINFGYATCPDVCPTTLVKLAEVDHLLGDLADQVQVLFISVDPDRDTAQVLENYVTSFDPAFIGLTGTRAAIDSVTGKYHVKYAFVGRDNDADMEYTVDHTSSVFFMGPNGEYIGRFSYATPAETIAKKVSETIKAAPPPA